MRTGGLSSMVLAAGLCACTGDPVAGSTGEGPATDSTGAAPPASTSDTPTGTTTGTTAAPTTGGTTEGVSASSTGQATTTTGEPMTGATGTTGTTGDTSIGDTTSGDTTTGNSTTGDTSTTGDGTTGGTTDPFACIEPTDSDTAADPGGWTRVYGQKDRYLTTRQLAVAPDGSVVIVTDFRGVLDLGDGPIDTGGARHQVIARYSAGGELQWSTHLGGGQNSEISYIALAIDCGGNVVIGGAFEGSIKLQGKVLKAVPGFWQEADIIYLTTDMFLAQLGANGQLRWARSFGDAAWQRIHDLDLQSDGTIVIGGSNRGTLELGGAPLVASGKFDGVIAAFDPDGGFLWQRSDSSASDVAVELLAVGPGGRIAAYGHAGAAVDLGGGELPTGGIYKWVGEFEADGAHRWSRRFLDATHTAEHIGADLGGGLVIAGDLSPGGSVLDGFVVRYDDTGVLQWKRQFDPAPVPAGKLRLGALAVGADITIAGQFLGGLDLGGGPLNVPVNTPFVARYDLAGAHLESTLLPGNTAAMPRGGARGPDGELVLGGDFKGELDLGAGAFMSVGDGDLFVHRFGP